MGRGVRESPAVGIIKALEPVYDETVILPGSETGECVAVAKRKGGKWFVAIENGTEDRTLEIPLSVLGTGKWRMKKFADAESSNIDFDISECTRRDSCASSGHCGEKRPAQNSTS